MGKVHAASAAASLKASYTNLRLAIVVGICGGVPRLSEDEDEILLGDVVISNALIQFDFGRRYPGGLFRRKASVQQSLGRSEELEFKRELEQNDPIRAQDPTIHIGPVASGDTVMKSGEDRDRIANEEGVIAFEMEGAGIWDEMPCLVIKGVCDYADSHKHKRWQDFAAATAAAAMKALLEALVDIQKPLNYPQLAFMAFKHQSLCAQVPLSPILVIDARGGNLPFHLESIGSKELFIEILKFRFHDLGTKKIDRGEWFLEDQSTGQRLDLSKPWQSIIKVLKMSMVFRRRNESRTECPSCQFMNPGLSTDAIQCHRCGLTYRRVEEIQSIQIDPEPNQEAKLSASTHPVGPKRPTQPSPEDEIGRYKQIQLVDVDFKIDQAYKGEQPIDTAVLLSRRDLRDSEHLAEELASIYGLSNQDSLALAKMAISSLPTSTGLLSHMGDLEDGMLPGDLQRAPFYDPVLERQMSHAEAKFFYQRSQAHIQSADPHDVELSNDGNKYDLEDDVLPRNSPSSTTFYDPIAEREIARIDAKSFYERSQLESMRIRDELDHGEGSD
ncbi:hypothetical protein G7Z17_g824 [Cylindrodendrum hubeiense]|uniref:Nucleoside phosphorylase domain-containing protein n=1 Tax=Cylindrodendrum hubeiense TaxID=595255 RepID=A0A9P5HMN8_9HYPO|nr:hypothetical protein G7Z17_g824 [Cylindrodendrum hubeiense]